MATLHELTAGNFKIFSRMNEAKRQRMMSIVGYIQTVARQAGADINEWDIIEVFGKGSGNELIEDRTEINKRLFGKLKEVAATAPTSAPTPITLSTKAQTTLKRLCAEKLAGNLAKLKEQIDKASKDAADRYKSFEESNVRRFEAQRLYDQLSGTGPDIAGQLQRIITTGQWELVSISDDGLLLMKTRLPVTINYSNPAEGTNLSVNLGFFSGEVRLSDGRVRVLPAFGNVTVDSHSHPHVRPDGTVCWGDAQSRLTEACSNLDVETVFNLIIGMLSQYNPNSPYIGLQRFQQEQLRRGA